MVTVNPRTALCLAALAACSGADPPPSGPGVGPPHFDPGDLDAPSHGGTITFQQIGAPGWYPSRRDPAVGPCDAYQTDTCCLARQEITGDLLTPWDEELILTLRGPMRVKQLAVYQPEPGADRWLLVSDWDDQTNAAHGLTFAGNQTETAGFPGSIGTECLVDVSTDRPFACGAGSLPFCPASSTNQHEGWRGSKLFVVLAAMPQAGMVAGACSTGTGGNWYDAPWIGLSHGELVRAGAFSSCQCYAKNPDQWYLGDGCGQFNAFEVVNDNNEFTNLDVFSSNFFGYAGYVGEGPCGPRCDVSALAPAADLIDKTTVTEAAAGAIATPTEGPAAAFRRPDNGYRYFLVLMAVDMRTVQLAIIHPEAIPAGIGALLPDLPATVSRETVDQVAALRLPR